MGKITKKDVEYVAKLARLRLSEDEKEKFTRQLDQILKYVDKLDELDTGKVKPTSHVLSLKNVFREDRAGKSLAVDKALENAPEKIFLILSNNYGYYRITAEFIQYTPILHVFQIDLFQYGNKSVVKPEWQTDFITKAQQ